MKTNITVTTFLLAIIVFLQTQSCWGVSIFETRLERNAIYTPGKMTMMMKLTDQARIDNVYHFLISIYVGDNLVRKQTVQVNKEKTAVFELAFPEMRSKSGVRCRAELFIDREFIEGQELPLTLWPPRASYQMEPPEKIIWIFDTSDYLQKFFNGMEIKIIDATFQSVRDFVKPDIVFLGQNLDPNSIESVYNRLAVQQARPVVILLQQKKLPKSSRIEIPEQANLPANMICDFNCPFLDELNFIDIMNLTGNASYIKVKGREQGWSITSYITEAGKEQKNIFSCLMTIKEEDNITVYCQLAADNGDPRYETLLMNLLKYAEKIIKDKKLDN